MLWCFGVRNWVTPRLMAVPMTVQAEDVLGLVDLVVDRQKLVGAESEPTRDGNQVACRGCDVDLARLVRVERGPGGGDGFGQAVEALAHSVDGVDGNVQRDVELLAQLVERLDCLPWLDALNHAVERVHTRLRLDGTVTEHTNGAHNAVDGRRRDRPPGELADGDEDLVAKLTERHLTTRGGLDELGRQRTMTVQLVGVEALDDGRLARRGGDPGRLRLQQPELLAGDLRFGCFLRERRVHPRGRGCRRRVGLCQPRGRDAALARGKRVYFLDRPGCARRRPVDRLGSDRWCDAAVAVERRVALDRRPRLACHWRRWWRWQRGAPTDRSGSDRSARRPHLRCCRCR
jgi:hypothetical protein